MTAQANSPGGVEGDRAGSVAVVAVVRGSAVRQDGRSASLTAPNGTARCCTRRWPRPAWPRRRWRGSRRTARARRWATRSKRARCTRRCAAGARRGAGAASTGQRQSECGPRRAGRGDGGAAGACGGARARAGGAECAAAAAQPTRGRGAARWRGVRAADWPGGDGARRGGLAGGRRVVVRVRPASFWRLEASWIVDRQWKRSSSLPSPLSSSASRPTRALPWLPLPLSSKRAAGTGAARSLSLAGHLSLGEARRRRASVAPPR